MDSTFAHLILIGQGIFGITALGFLIYFLVKRIEKKKLEQFEDRND